MSDWVHVCVFVSVKRRRTNRAENHVSSHLWLDPAGNQDRMLHKLFFTGRTCCMLGKQGMCVVYLPGYHWGCCSAGAKVSTASHVLPSCPPTSCHLLSSVFHPLQGLPGFPGVLGRPVGSLLLAGMLERWRRKGWENWSLWYQIQVGERGMNQSCIEFELIQQVAFKMYPHLPTADWNN